MPIHHPLHGYFGLIHMRNHLDKQRKTASREFKLKRSGTVRRALSDNDSNSAKSVKLKWVAAASKCCEEAEGRLVRY